VSNEKYRKIVNDGGNAKQVIREIEER
jgi:hypothetical protein